MFGFIINLLLGPISFLLGFKYAGSDYLVTQVTANTLFISPSITYNALTTMLYPFLRDLGFIGVIIGTASLALFISSVEKYFSRGRQLIFLCLYVYLGFIIFNSIMVYQLLLPGAGVTIILIFLFINKDSPKKVTKE
jgi:hypothetical protein